MSCGNCSGTGQPLPGTGARRLAAHEVWVLFVSLEGGSDRRRGFVRATAAALPALGREGLHLMRCVCVCFGF